MKINIQLQIDDSKARQIIEESGHEIIEHDFGRWDKRHHNQLQWVEDLRPAIKLDHEYLRLADAISRLYNDKIQDLINLQIENI